MPDKAPELDPATKAVAEYLVSSKSELKLRETKLKDKRISYFKGKHAVNALLRPNAKPLNLDPESALSVLTFMLRKELMFKITLKPVALATNYKFATDQDFDPLGYYVMVYQGSRFWSYVAAIGVLLLVFVGVLFPLWPPFMRQGSYYVSLLMLGLLGLLMALGVFRWILWILLVVTMGRGGWLYPNLFADVGIIESFYPLWVWDKPKPKNKQE